MACNESLKSIKAMQATLQALLDEMVKADDRDLPGNTLNKIPDGWQEDVKRFTVGDGAVTVAATDVTKQLTEMETGLYYIIKEVRFYASGTVTGDANFNIYDTESKTVFGQGYYNEGSFTIFTGNRNGLIGKPLKQKPTVTLNSGTGAAAQKWYGSVKYYFR